MAIYPDEIVQQLKAHADISQVIQRFIPLKRSGTGRFLGKCPFHDDRSPSMNVNPQMGIFKCFACGAGGDVFKFVMDHEKIDFKSAIELVAQETGFPLPSLEGQPDAAHNEERALVKTLNELACNWFQGQLQQSQSSLEYLAKRGITDATRERFRFGYAPESREGFIAFAARQGFSPRQVVQAGLATERENGGISDKFRGRLMVPIQNLSGVVVGFGGRILDPQSQAPKYMNSPETALYTKSDILFGLNHSRHAIAKSESVVLVEGYFDLISLFQAGIENVVAASGTALTEQHSRILARYAKTAYLVFDGDAAGKKATRRSLEVLLPHSLAARVLLFGNSADLKVDPDSFIREKGPDAFRQLLGQAPDWLHWLATESPLNTTEERAVFVGQAKSLVAAILDPELREQYLRLLQERFSVSRNLYNATPIKVRKEKRVQAAVPEEEQAPPRPHVPWQSLHGAELRFVTLVIRHNSLWAAALRLFEPAQLESGLLAELLDYAYGLYEETQNISLPILHSKLPPVLQELLEGLPDENWADANAQKEFFETLLLLQLRHAERLRRQARDDLETFLFLNTKVRHLTDVIKNFQTGQTTAEQLLPTLLELPKELKNIQSRLQKKSPNSP